MSLYRKAAINISCDYTLTKYWRVPVLNAFPKDKIRNPRQKHWYMHIHRFSQRSLDYKLCSLWFCIEKPSLVYHMTKFWLNFDVFPSSTLFLSAKFGILVKKRWYMYLGSFSEGCIQHSTSQCVVVVMKCLWSRSVILVTWYINGSFI